MDNIVYGTNTNNTNILPSYSNVLLINSNFTPIGAIIQYSGSNIPSGWLLCNGNAISRTSYSSLYSAIGTSYGVGDGSTTFNIPDLRSRIGVGYNSTGTFSTLGNTGGSTSVVLTATNIPAHTHFVFSDTTTSTVGSISASNSPARYLVSGTSSTNYIMTTTNDPATVGNTSFVGGTAHNNMQPYIVVNYLIYAGKNVQLNLVNNVSSITSLTDISITTPITGQSLSYNGTSSWINYTKDYLALNVYGTSLTTLYDSQGAVYKTILILNSTYWSSTIPDTATNTNAYLVSKGSGLTYSKTTGRISGLNASKYYRVDATVDLSNLDIGSTVTWKCALQKYSGSSYSNFSPDIFTLTTQFAAYEGVSMKLGAFITNCTEFTLVNSTTTNVAVNSVAGQIDSIYNIVVVEL